MDNKRLEMDPNPFYDSNASASIFGWDFQINAGIFLFLKYNYDVDHVKIEGKYQDIELYMKDNSIIYAQAKSVQNGDITNRGKKLKDALISLLKTPMNYANGDKLLYVSNYEKPIKDSIIFQNSIRKMENDFSDMNNFKKTVKNLKTQLQKEIDKLTNGVKKDIYTELLKRIYNLDINNFLVSSIYPYVDAEQEFDRYQQIIKQIEDLMVSDFGINSSYLTSWSKKILKQWQCSFQIDASKSPDNLKDIDITLSRVRLLLELIAVIATDEFELNSELLSYEIDLSMVEEFENYYSKRLFYHDRFEFINKLYLDYKTSGFSNIEGFIKNKWEAYILEYEEFKNHEEKAKEYLVKKDLIRLFNNKNNISKVIKGK